MDWCECLFFQKKLGFVEAKSMLNYWAGAENNKPELFSQEKSGFAVYALINVVLKL